MSPKKPRKKIPAAIRDRLLVQVGHRCVRCLSTAAEVDIHHILALANGGDDAEENLVVLCPTCHRLAHRYNISARQLREYKRQVVDGRNAQLLGFEPLYMDSFNEPSSDTLLVKLQVMVEDWCNELVTTAAESLEGGREAKMAIFKYTHGRRFLPHVVGIRDALVERGELPDIVSDVGVLLSLLTEVEVEEHRGLG